MAIERARQEITQGYVAAGLDYLNKGAEALKAGKIINAKENSAAAVRSVDNTDLASREIGALHHDLSALSGREDIPEIEFIIMATSKLDEDPEFGIRPILPALADLMLEDARKSAVNVAIEALGKLEGGDSEVYKRLSSTVPDIIDRGTTIRDRILQTSQSLDKDGIKQPTVSELLGLIKPAEKLAEETPAPPAPKTMKLPVIPSETPAPEETHMQKIKLVMSGDKSLLEFNNVKVTLNENEKLVVEKLIRAGGRPISIDDTHLNQSKLRSIVSKLNKAVGTVIIESSKTNQRIQGYGFIKDVAALIEEISAEEIKRQAEERETGKGKSPKVRPKRKTTAGPSKKRIPLPGDEYLKGGWKIRSDDGARSVDVLGGLGVKAAFAINQGLDSGGLHNLSTLTVYLFGEDNPDHRRETMKIIRDADSIFGRIGYQVKSIDAEGKLPEYRVEQISQNQPPMFRP